MLEFLKNYYVFMLVLLVFSYLVPKDEYKRYMHFFISVFMVVLFLKPVLEFMYLDDPTFLYEVFESFNHKLQQLDFEIEKGESIFEYFFLEGEGE